MQTTRAKAVNGFHWTKTLSEELKKSNINVNCIMPSIIDTEANRRAMPTADYSKWLKPSDLANVV
ncbi:MAG: hypothetical protein ACJ71R_20590, partial [Nitrososphaeraceae archaeon]